MVPTNEPTSATATPTGQPTLEPTLKPTGEPTGVPTLEPTVEPTGVPTLEPTTNPFTTTTVAPTTSAPTSNRRRRLLSNGTTRMPTMEPTLQPSESPTAYTIYDLRLEVGVSVASKAQSDEVYARIGSYFFFAEWKRCLLDALQSEWLQRNVSNASSPTWQLAQSEWRGAIESMQESPLQAVEVVSPTHLPTPYPTYDYEGGREFGNAMMGVGVCMLAAVAAYAAYRRYATYQDRKLERIREQKSAPPASGDRLGVELQQSFLEEA